MALKEFSQVWDGCLEFNIEQKPEEFKLLWDFLSKRAEKKCALEIESNYGGTTFALCNLFDQVLTLDIKHHPNFDRLTEQFPGYQ